MTDGIIDIIASYEAQWFAFGAAFGVTLHYVRYGKIWKAAPFAACFAIYAAMLL